MNQQQAAKSHDKTSTVRAYMELKVKTEWGKSQWWQNFKNYLKRFSSLLVSVVEGKRILRTCYFYAREEMEF